MQEKPSLAFEVSWEVANKVGGIYTVLTGKAPLLEARLEARYICIGPHLSASRRHWKPANLYPEWRAHLERRYGLQVHPGYWQIGKHAIQTWLLDFHPFLSEKDKVFAWLWERFRVESLWGGWDYIEPTIFGYTAGLVIHSFCEFYYPKESVAVVAHFHEWLTGAGVLYLKGHYEVAATVFTTHATVIGRASAGERVQGDLQGWAASKDLLSKYSLERAAWEQADVVTTVGEGLAREATLYLGRAPDVLTPNGWDPPIVDPEKARLFLAQLRKAWGIPAQERVFWLLHSGRPELENKGTLSLLEALSRYQKAPVNGVTLGVMVAMPNQVRKATSLLHSRLWISHEPLSEDPLYQHLRALADSPGEGVYYAYLPIYLEGLDELLSFTYYELLGAMDASAFPSRYEPWGYTPQESLGLGVPTLSSVQAGFGAWMKGHVRPLPEALGLVDYAQGDVPGQILSWLYTRLRLVPAAQKALREQARILSSYTRWKRFLPFYWEAYGLALKKRQVRQWYYESPTSDGASGYRWRRAFFVPTLPEALQPLRRLAYNLWWTWRPQAQELFSRIQPEAWLAHENPVWLLNHTPFQRWQVLLEDKSFMQLLAAVDKDFTDYMASPLQVDKPRVLYLSLEYGLGRLLPLYSGGLGVLAGDYLKEMSDAAYPAWAVGLLYRHGYFVQEVSSEGEQVVRLVPLRFSDLPLEPLRQADGRWVRLQISLPGGPFHLKVWKVAVGRIPLYLLDADIEENTPEQRRVTSQLYPTDSELRLLQELVLGLGAEGLARALGLTYDIAHYNEGHVAFHFLARVETLIGQGLSLAQAIELAQARTLFTTHTPVPAGHESFPLALVEKYVEDYVTQRLGWDWADFVRWGEVSGERFQLTAFALRASAQTNAVSLLHAKVSQKMFQPYFPTYLAQELPIPGITNGVHRATWQAAEWERSRRTWETHLSLKRRLAAYLEHRLQRQAWPEPYLEAIQRFFQEGAIDTLWMGFARRLVTYKRHGVLFQSKRLASLFEKYPLRLLIAGKAHPADEGGAAMLKAIWQHLQEPPFLGKVLFIPDYDMALARYLVQGLDVWLNFPTYGQEASGTSGMKALLNGVLHVSIPDGWWAEVDAEKAGSWTIPLSPDQQAPHRDLYEAAQLAYVLEEEVIPAYLQRDAEGLPQLWIERIRKAQAYAEKHYTTQRMLSEYTTQLYEPMHQRAQRLEAEGYAILNKRLERKARLARALPELKVKALRLPPFVEQAQLAQEPFTVELEIEPTSLPPEERPAEIIFEHPEGAYFRFVLEPVSPTLYRGQVMIPDPGVYHWAIRLYPFDPDLGERWYEPSVLIS